MGEIWVVHDSLRQATGTPAGQAPLPREGTPEIRVSGGVWGLGRWMPFLHGGIPEPWSRERLRRPPLPLSGYGRQRERLCWLCLLSPSFFPCTTRNSSSKTWGEKSSGGTHWYQESHLGLVHHQPPGWSVVAWRETSPSTGAFSWPQLLSFSHITYADSLGLKLEDFVHTCSARTPPRLWNNSAPPPLLQPLEGLWWLLGSKDRWFSWELYSYCGQIWFGCLAMCLCQPFGLGRVLHPHSSPRLCWKRQHPVTPTKVATEQKTSWKMLSISLLSVHLIASRVFSSHIFFPLSWICSL